LPADRAAVFCLHPHFASVPIRPDTPHHARVAIRTEAAALTLDNLQGPAIQLKKFHNDVKRELIKTFAGGARRLLDLGCGRGGDLHKWADAGIKHVVGVDLSPKEIEEAKRRFRELRGKPLEVDFSQSDALGLTSPILFGPRQTPEAFDAVTCVTFGAPAFPACVRLCIRRAAAAGFDAIRMRPLQLHYARAHNTLTRAHLCGGFCRRQVHVRSALLFRFRDGAPAHPDDGGRQPAAWYCASMPLPL